MQVIIIKITYKFTVFCWITPSTLPSVQGFHPQLLHVPQQDRCFPARTVNTQALQSPSSQKNIHVLQCSGSPKHLQSLQCEICNIIFRNPVFQHLKFNIII